MSQRYIKVFLVVALLVLVGCIRREPAAQVPTTAPVATAQPGAPTAAPVARPTFAFEPRGGGPGTVVTVKGWGFQPNSWVGVYLGIPGPVGTALNSARADGAGAWQVAVTIPGNLPEGAPVPAENIFLVSMSDQMRPLTSARFGFQAPAPQRPPIAQARDNVRTLLAAYGTADVRPYLFSTLRQRFDEGRSLPDLIGFDPLLMEARPELGEPQQRPGGGVVEQGVIASFPGELRHYSFTLGVEDGFWKVMEVQFVRSEPVHYPFPGPGWALRFQHDANGDGVAEGYYVRPEQPATTFSFADPYLRQHSVATTGLLVGWAEPHNAHLLLSADHEGLRAGAEPLLAYSPERAAGYVAAFDRRGPFLVYLQPIRADGSALGETATLIWDAGAQGFRFYQPAMDQTPAGQPGRIDAGEIGTLLRDEFRLAHPGKPVISGAVATACLYEAIGWEVQIAGQAFAPEGLDRLGLPAGIRA